MNEWVLKWVFWYLESTEGQAVTCCQGQRCFFEESLDWSLYSECNLDWNHWELWKPGRFFFGLILTWIVHGLIQRGKAENDPYLCNTVSLVGLILLSLFENTWVGSIGKGRLTYSWHIHLYCYYTSEFSSLYQEKKKHEDVQAFKVFTVKCYLI